MIELTNNPQWQAIAYLCCVLLIGVLGKCYIDYRYRQQSH
jgi:hypothetical protein